MPTSDPSGYRRGFLRSLFAASGLSAAAASSAAAQSTAKDNDFSYLPRYARAQNYKSLKQSSYDRTGGNADRWPIARGGTQEVFKPPAPASSATSGSPSRAQSPNHLKEVVLRACTGTATAKPSVEVPVGDFFGLNLGKYFIYESEYLACSPGRSLNCYFSMPYRKSARITVTNEGTRPSAPSTPTSTT